MHASRVRVSAAMLLRHSMQQMREREREAAKLEKGGEMNCISTVPGTIEYFYSGYFTDGL